MERFDNALDICTQCLEIDSNFEDAKNLHQEILKKKEEKKSEEGRNL